MKFSIQPHLENELAELIPLNEIDFEKLYAVASDPAVWANHPNKNRYEKEIFRNFFKGAIESGGAFVIRDKRTGNIAGSTRFYDYDKNQKSIHIGYTFYATDYWGRGYNSVVKRTMLNYIFQYVDKVLFHVGAENYRSQSAMKKLNTKKVREITVAYYGEPEKRNFEYEIVKEDWLKSDL